MSTVYEIGPFRLDPEAGVLIRAGLPMPLGARAVAVLTTLVKKHNEFVPKETILDAAWQNVVVEESNLSTQISAIRRAFAEVPGGKHWIETLARRGYRFVGPLTEVGGSLPKGASGERENSNLPELLTSFIGRERELVEIKRLLPTTRLLTVVGAGGIGKTRLALQTASEVTAAYRDGVWLVELAPLTDPALVPSAVAQALGTREAPGRPVVDTIVRELKGRQLLLVLDNCEHLLDACAHLADALLKQVADLAIVATSREALQVPGEQTYALAPLSLPDPARSTVEVARADAVQLFLARARKQQLDFTLTAERTRIIAELCVRLDGIPLALELAAARLRSLSIEQIHARLDDRFRLLADGARTAQPRQRTLRATIDWSHDLLTEDERAVLRRLTVFAGGFTLDAVAYVAADARIDAVAVADVMSQLVARSLVVMDTLAEDARYHLLETMRAYGQERLDEAGETAATKARHVDCFVAQFTPAHDDWLSLREVDWRSRYAPDIDNVRVALDWALDTAADVGTGIRLCSASAPLWMELSLTNEGRQRLEKALAIGTDAPPEQRARLWLWLAMLWGDAVPPEAARALSEAIALYRSLGDTEGLGFALVQFAFKVGTTDRLDDAVAALDEATPLLARAAHRRARARCDEVRGFLTMRRGDLAAALAHYESSLALYRDIGVQKEVLRTLGNKADLIWALGDAAAAAADFRETVSLLRESPFTTKRTLGFNLVNLSGVLTELGDLDGALDTAEEGLALLAGTGYSWANMDHFALRAALAGHLEDAARLAAYADTEFTAREAIRGPNEARARERLDAVLKEGVAHTTLARLREEGARLTEADASQIAVRRRP